jgi:flagellar basal body-associated protein FliL
MLGSALLIGNALMVSSTVAAQEPKPAPAAKAPELAVIVNLKNLTPNLTLPELRTYCKLEMQYWSDNQRVRLYLRSYRSPEMKILLATVYRMEAGPLRKYWHGRENRGEITKRPTIVASATAAIARVRAGKGAFAFVLAKDVPKGVRVLAVDGKLPGEEGYALKGEAAPIKKSPVKTVANPAAPNQ